MDSPRKSRYCRQQPYSGVVMFESRDPQRSIAVGRTLIAGCALALAVGACGRSSASKDMPAPSANSVIAAMNTQPRIIESVAGSGTVGRIIVDANARYLGLYSPSGMLTVMDKQGVEFRLLASGCYGRFAAAPVSTRVMWLGALEPLTSPRYTTTTSGDSLRIESGVASHPSRTSTPSFLHCR